jgi:hypothetical protein
MLDLYFYCKALVIIWVNFKFQTEEEGDQKGRLLVLCVAQVDRAYKKRLSNFLSRTCPTRI